MKEDWVSVEVVSLRLVLVLKPGIRFNLLSTLGQCLYHSDRVQASLPRGRGFDSCPLLGTFFLSILRNVYINWSLKEVQYYYFP